MSCNYIIHMSDSKSNGENTVDMSFFKSFIIIFLLIIIILAILGISLYTVFGNIFKALLSGILSIIYKVLAFFGFTLGYTVNTTTDIIVDTTKFGIDVTGGAVHDVGNLILKASGDPKQFAPNPAAAKVNSQNLFNAINNPAKSSFVNMVNEFPAITSLNMAKH